MTWDDDREQIGRGVRWRWSIGVLGERGGGGVGEEIRL